MGFKKALVSARGDRPQAEIAKQCDVDQGTISRWEDEQSKSKPHPSRLPTLSAAYGISERRLRRLWMELAAADGRVSA